MLRPRRVRRKTFTLKELVRRAEAVGPASGRRGLADWAHGLSRRRPARRLSPRATTRGRGRATRRRPGRSYRAAPTRSTLGWTLPRPGVVAESRPATAWWPRDLRRHPCGSPSESDHAGFDLKAHLVDHPARGSATTVVDLGTDCDESVDYPRVSAPRSARAVVAGDADRGHRARRQRPGRADAPPTRCRGVRAALCNDLYTARMSREHNDANVLVHGRPHRRPRPGRRDRRAAGCTTARSRAAATSAASTSSARSPRSAPTGGPRPYLDSLIPSITARAAGTAEGAPHDLAHRRRHRAVRAHRPRASSARTPRCS